MSNSSEAVKEWRKNSKQRMVDSMGGKCQICNYDKCNNALELHHIDSNLKEISFGKIRANPKSWDTIVAELKKCILLCSNCHKELHSGLIELPTEYNEFRSTYEKYVPLIKEKTYCPVCEEEKSFLQKTCSLKCAGSLKGKVNWNSIDLLHLKHDKKMTNSSIAEMLGISEAAVRKRLIKINFIP